MAEEENSPNPLSSRWYNIIFVLSVNIYKSEKLNMYSAYVSRQTVLDKSRNWIFMLWQ